MTPGWILPTVVLQDAIKGWLDDVESARQLAGAGYDAFLGRIYANVSPADLTSIKHLLEKDFTFVRNYPIGDTQFPAIVTILAEETRTKYVGDTGGRWVGDEGEQYYMGVERWSTTLEILSMSEHPLEIEWMHQLLKFGLQVKRRQIESAGVRHLEQVRSRDLGFEPRLLEAGQYVYRRSIIYSMEYDQVDVDPLDLLEVSVVTHDALSGASHG